MAEFLKDSKLNAALENIFEDARKQLVIVSPYIKLHSRLRDILKSKKDEHKLEITIVFGENKDNLTKSFSREEFDFFREFPNIEIKYESRLHAKYYANESAALLSSMNLYEFSQNNNIEFGILTKVSFLGGLTGLGEKIDSEAFNYFDKVINNGKTLYSRNPCYEEKLIGFKEKYTHSEIEIDELTKEFATKSTYLQTNKTIQTQKDNHSGYCIRTGVKIPFNPDRPLSDIAYNSWSKYKDKNYKEKYCHYSGELSNGETSFANPIMKKNLSKALRKQI